MTHPTDKELDALVERLQNVSLQVGFLSRTILASHVIHQSAEAITALRAQLAEVQAERDAVVTVRDMLGNRWATEKDRADRAEAALAALVTNQPADPVTNAGCCQALLAERDDLRAKLDEAVEALEKLHHAVCGETGFAQCVRDHSQTAYPWPALDEADGLARATLTKIKGADHE